MDVGYLGNVLHYTGVHNITNKKIMLVLVKPPGSDQLCDKLFQKQGTSSGQWLSFMAEVRRLLCVEGFELHTWDMCPLNQADIILCQDLTLTRAELVRRKAMAPRAKFVLQILETPLDRLHHHDPRNHDLFDAVVTYNKRDGVGERYFHYNIPVARPDCQARLLAYRARRPLVMINSNRVTRIFGSRQAGLAGLPGVGPMFSGWHVALGTLMRQGRGQLYCRRRRLALAAESYEDDIMDIYGYGWQGEPISWLHKFISNRVYACGCGIASGWKMDYLKRYRFSIAYENMRSDVGYISEKIFDPMFAGTVPVYLGDEKISDIVPASCYVDARRFISEYELLEYVRDCSELEWRKMSDAGREYVNTDKFERFLPSQLAKVLSVAFNFALLPMK